MTYKFIVYKEAGRFGSVALRKWPLTAVSAKPGAVSAVVLKRSLYCRKGCA